MQERTDQPNGPRIDGASLDPFEKQCLELGLDVLSLEDPASSRAKTPASLAKNPAAATEHPWILHVESDIQFGQEFKEQIEAEDFNVASAYSGLEGLQLAFDRPTEAIVAEFDLPNGKGDFLLRRLKANSLTSSIPVIFLLAAQDRRVESQLLMQGAEAVYYKPTDYLELANHLKRLTGQFTRFSSGHSAAEIEPKSFSNDTRRNRRRPKRALPGNLTDE